MQTLGLSSKPQPADSIFKRLFWPAIESAYDVDLLGQQGFWVCTSVAAFSALMLALAGWPTLAAIYGLAFFLGGCGVRERSIVAAVIVFILYALNIVTRALAGGFGSPVLTAVIVMLLFANIRATVIARMWADAPDHSDLGELPERSSTSPFDRFANLLPTRIWPIGQYIFYPTAVVIFLLLSLSIAALQKAKHEAVRQPAAASSDSN